MSVWIGLDIGGANLKAADGRGWCRSVPFPLWREPERLSAALAELLRIAPDVDGVAVTMTGELADCFETKATGVDSILTSVSEALEAVGKRSPVRVYRTDGALVDMSAAREEPLLVAAANWHALAAFGGRYVTARAALMLDLGSTTCDLIPLIDGEPAAQGRTDPERLVSGELVYTGVVRSPVCALVSELPWRGRMCRVAQEVFATTRDAYLLLEGMPENASDLNTADSRPATRHFALDRLARQICADRTLFNADDALAAASVVKQAQLALLGAALRQICAIDAIECSQVILSGQGEFLLRELLAAEMPNAEIISLAERLGPGASQAAAAHALAVLAAERFS
jgi:probable H4MPT-linked C1 transfer pathway protein